MNSIKRYISSVLILIVCSSSFASDDEDVIVKLENQIEDKSLQIDTSSILTEEKINEVKEYIAYMEALLKKNNVGFSKPAIAKKSKIDEEINAKLLSLKKKLQAKEKAIQKQKEKNKFLVWGIAGVSLFVIPIILSFLLSRNNKKSKAKNLELESNNKEVEKAYSDIKSSINYANRIQSSVLVKQEILNKYVSDSFIFFEPKEDVSGDFYFFAEIEGKMIVATVDCASEGVAGAFLTMMWLSFMNEIVKRQKVTSPSEILKIIDERICDSLSKNTESTFEDGMIMSIVTLDKEQDVIEFSGANQSILYVENNKLQKVEGVNRTVGISQKIDNKIEFENHTLKLSTVSHFYIYTHGFYTQIGGENKKRYSEKRFTDFIFDNHSKSINEQKALLKKEFDGWKKEFDQTEDVLVIGVKLD